MQSAQAELTVLAKQLENQHPDRNPVFPRLVPLEQHVSGQVRPALLVLMCAVGVVMLIVCANLSHLQLARMGTRQKEMAVRSALGAGRYRLLRQVLTESITLSCCGAALGLLLAVAGTRGLAHLSAFNLPLLASVRVDGSTLAFTLLAAVASGVLFGLAPALQITAHNLREGLQDAGRESSGGTRHGWFGDGLVVSQYALACVLLVGAALLMQSFLRVLDVNLGFQPEHAACVENRPGFSDPESGAAELIYRRCVASRPISPRHCGGRDKRCASARRGQELASRGPRTGLRQGPSPGSIYSRRERWIFRGPRDRVEVGKSIDRERSSIERTRSDGE